MLNNLNGYISSFLSRNLTVLNMGDLDTINSSGSTLSISICVSLRLKIKALVRAVHHYP